MMSCNGAFPTGTLTSGLEKAIPVPGEGAIRMRVEVRRTTLRVFYAVEDGAWQRIGSVLDASLLSDECGEGEHANFTGAFVGMAANDLSGRAFFFLCLR